MTRTALYGPQFAAHPHAHYARLRDRGPLAPVELAPGIDAWLVTDYHVALEILRDTDTWTRDPRVWQATQPADSPIMPMLGWRPTALFSDGATHARYRQVITDSVGIIEPHLLQRDTTAVAEQLIAEFAHTGKADILAQYAYRLPLLILCSWYGIPDQDLDRISAAMNRAFESSTGAIAAYADLVAVITGLVAERRTAPRHDLISAFANHPARLADEEVVRHITLTLMAGHEPTANLTANALLRMLSDERYAGSLHSGALSAHDAVNEVLWTDPPLSNFAPHYSRRNIVFHGTPIAPDEPVLISYASANAQAALPASESESLGGSYAHLAWGAGPHRCPARQPAVLMAVTAIEYLISRLTDLRLAVPADRILWRQGPVHRALVSLPVTFTAL
ncbi:cytochrome P450 [Kitasatospora sp. CB01950]|uniref:cytochrome P450 n=1 Tax=Kitasatospora sp. CB01950 TaxID=1703930 RepID=UPI0009397CD9|nr:cytochrome P450 [Kitasatospora sp. CB01950]OKJ07446.1 cytochrome [Kitasatospora sp. CB01950]